MTTRSRADAFARALDARSSDARAAPAWAGDEGALLTALSTLRSDLDDVGSPSPQWRSAQRNRLLAVAAVAPAPGTGPVAGAGSRLHGLRSLARLHGLRSPRRISVLAGALAFAVALTGIAVGATRSLPGQPLYAAKRATEALQLYGAGDSLERGNRHLQFAETRLREVSALASGRGSLALPNASSHSRLLASGAGAGPIGWALADMDFQTRTGSDLVRQAARDSDGSALFLVLQQWSSEQADRLRTVVPALPGAERERAQASLSVIAAVGADATSALVSCPPGPGGCPSAVGPGPKGFTGSHTGRGPLAPVPVPVPAAPNGSPALPVPSSSTPGGSGSTGKVPGPVGTIPGPVSPAGVAPPNVPAGGAPTGGLPSPGLPPSQLSLTVAPSRAPAVPPAPPTSPRPANPSGLPPTLPTPAVPVAAGAPSAVPPGP